MFGRCQNFYFQKQNKKKQINLIIRIEICYRTGLLSIHINTYMDETEFSKKVKWFYYNFEEKKIKIKGHIIIHNIYSS